MVNYKGWTHYTFLEVVIGEDSILSEIFYFVLLRKYKGWTHYTFLEVVIGEDFILWEKLKINNLIFFGRCNNLII